MKRVIEGDAGEAARYHAWFLERFLDPEGFVVQSFTLLFGGFAVEALDLLERGVARGFACPSALDTLAVFAPIAGTSRFAALREAAARNHVEACRAYLENGGPRLLGPLEVDAPPTVRTRPG